MGELLAKRRTAQMRAAALDVSLCSMSIEDPARERSTSFGEGHQLTVVDRFGTWLSGRAIRSVAADVDGAVVADIGCGYDARLGRSLLPRARRLVVADVSLHPTLVALPDVEAHVGLLPRSLDPIASGSVDLVLLCSVLEHLDDPVGTLVELRRIARPDGGTVFVNVPSWRGKAALELSAFRFGWSPRLEIDDHRRYYDRRSLWQQLRDAGFLPSGITVRSHKFGLNLYAVARRSEAGG